MAAPTEENLRIDGKKAIRALTKREWVQIRACLTRADTMIRAIMIIAERGGLTDLGGEEVSVILDDAAIQVQEVMGIIEKDDEKGPSIPAKE